LNCRLHAANFEIELFSSRLGNPSPFAPVATILRCGSKQVKPFIEASGDSLNISAWD
jgi:hypothetical protein